MELNTLAERVRHARYLKKMSQKDLAKTVGISASAIMYLENGRNVTSKYIYDIAKALDVSVEWLLNDEKKSANEDSNVVGDFIPVSAWDDDTPLDVDDVEIPFLKEITLSAGNGTICLDDYNDFKLRFSRRSLKKFNVSAKDAVCVTVRGNSMSPAIPDGSTIGIDTDKHDIKSGEIYAFMHNDDMFIKVLYKDIGGVRAVSFNAAEYPEKELKLSEIKVIGRVFWWSVLR